MLSTISQLHASSLHTHPDAGIILTDPNGAVLFAQNEDKLLIPASILKILTSLAAIHYLGEEYQFKTRYFFDNISTKAPDNISNRTLGNLYIKGYGDPMLTSEVLEALRREIIASQKPARIHDIMDIILDHSYYAQHIDIPGKGNSKNPYDAPVGVLAANYNTVEFKWDRKTKKFISGEPQTPLLDIFPDEIKKAGLKKGRIVIEPELSKVYPGLLLKYFFEEHGIKITGKIREGYFGGDENQMNIFISPYDLKDLIQKLLHYSNNFIANQILLTMGAEILGPPATLEKSIRLMHNFIDQKLKLNQELKLKGIIIKEGSGLSRENRISPSQMIIILKLFMPYYKLLRKEKNDFFKTGTLTGVRTRAGYLMGKKKRLYPYVIMLNRPDGNPNYANILNYLNSTLLDSNL